MKKLILIALLASIVSCTDTRLVRLDSNRVVELWTETSTIDDYVSTLEIGDTLIVRTTLHTNSTYDFYGDYSGILPRSTVDRIVIANDTIPVGMIYFKAVLIK